MGSFDKHRDHYQHLSYLMFMEAAVGTMLDPEHTDSVFDIEDGLRGNSAAAELLGFKARDYCMNAVIFDRYLLPEVPHTEKLRELSEDTLGWAYADHLDSMGFDPDYYRKTDVKDDMEYLMMRIRRTHDILRVVTGFDTRPFGEITVKVAELAQTHRPTAAAICIGDVFRSMMHGPERFGECIETTVVGYHLDLRSRPPPSMGWEEHWGNKVEDIRKGLDVIPLGPHGGEVMVGPSRHSQAVANRRAREETAEALKEIKNVNPDGHESDPGMDHDQSQTGEPDHRV